MYHRIHTIEDIVLTIIAAFFFFIFLPMALSIAGVNGLVVFVICVAGLILSVYLINKLLHKQWLPHYEEWKKAIHRMGLNEQDNSNNPPVTGVYRNHRVTVRQRIFPGDGDADSGETHYYVEFENPKNILLHIKRRSFYVVGTPSTPEVYARKVQEFKVGDTNFDSKFVVKGKEENFVRPILDSSFRAEMIRIRKTLSPGCNIEVGYVSSIPNLAGLSNWDIFRLREDVFGYREESNIAHYIDPRMLSRVEEDAERIQAILDIMIYIVEKIETYNPS